MYSFEKEVMIGRSMVHCKFSKPTEFLWLLLFHGTPWHLPKILLKKQATASVLSFIANHRTAQQKKTEQKENAAFKTHFKSSLTVIAF